MLRTRCVEVVHLVKIQKVVWIISAIIVLKWTLHKTCHKTKNTQTFPDRTYLETPWCWSSNSDNSQSSTMHEWKQHLKVFITRQLIRIVDSLLENLSHLAFLIHDARSTHLVLQDSLRTFTVTRLWLEYRPLKNARNQATQILINLGLRRPISIVQSIEWTVGNQNENSSLHLSDLTEDRRLKVRWELRTLTSHNAWRISLESSRIDLIDSRVSELKGQYSSREGMWKQVKVRMRVEVTLIPNPVIRSEMFITSNNPKVVLFSSWLHRKRNNIE